MSEDPTPPDVPADTSDQVEPRRSVQMVALDPTFLRRSVLIILVGILLFQILEWSALRLAGFLFNLLLAWLLAISFDPLVSGLAKRGLPRALATAIVAVGVIAGIVIFLVLFGGALASQATALVLSVPFLIVDVVSWLNGTFDARIDPAEITSNLNLTTQQLADLAGSLAGGLLGIISGVFGAIFSFVTIIVFSFYFSASAPQIKRFLASWLKPERQVVFIEVWDISVRKAGGFVISKLVLATVAAAAHVAFFWIIDIPYWLPMGIFAGFVSQFIPTIGTYIGIIVPAFFAAFNDPWDVLWIVLFATIYQQIENYIFSPRISTATMAINSGVALASVFIGAALFGPIGAIIGIPVIAIVIAVIETYGRRYELDPELHDRV
ncbi:MAG: AI-2E family transporter [Candidatus Nanopelagicales bacterium]|nr:AI-2E family transporter [Candidatus Nanopelagicales bacterium]MBL6834219.1 AI-2E family transporter [Candidatus Nanopelagicales bacterium]MCH9850356.1 AI-2E family transporter [Actinomycetes bacterium]